MAPTIQFVEKLQRWEMRYGDVMRYHQQEWQVRVWFEAALAVYAGNR